MVEEHLKRRIFFIGLIFTALTIVLSVKLFCMQADFQGYDNRIQRQSIRKIRIPTQRGRIYSADRKIIADNKMFFDLMLYIHEIKKPGRSNTINAIFDEILEMSWLLKRENTLSRKNIESHLIQSPGLPIRIFSDLTEKECAVINDYMSSKNGWAIDISAKRFYPHKNWASHIIGYTGKEEKPHAPDLKDFSYYIADEIGKDGLEKVFDSFSLADKPNLHGLRGKPGYSLVQVDNLGYVHHSLLEEIAPIHGNHLILNIEFDAQKKAQEILKNHKGAFVLVDADTGDVIAMASSPDYDLNTVRKKYNDLKNDTATPLLPRATMGTYTPGSIIKVLVALAILENGKNPEETVFCDGYSQVYDAQIKCTSYWAGGHRDMDTVTALEKSCNDYFIEEGIKLGREKLCSFMQMAGFGQNPELEIPSAKGILPTIANKQRFYKTSRWTDFDTALISIGQGMITITPLQAALYCAAIANGGKVYQPHLVNSVVDHQGNILFERTVKVNSVINASEENFNIVRQGMFQVVNSPTGSGRKGKLPDHTIYGKTGTAEIGSGKNRRQNTWFISFVTHKGKTYASALIIQDGQSGGATAAPLAAEFYNWYLSTK